MSKKRGFSLIEIVVLLALISIVSSLLAVNIKRSMNQASFKESVSLIEHHINEAKRLALLTQGGITLVFSNDEQHHLFLTIRGEALPACAFKTHLAVPRQLTGVSHISFQSATDIPYAWPIQLVIYPNGQTFSDREKLPEDTLLNIASSYGGTRSLKIGVAPPITLQQEGKAFYPREFAEKGGR